MAASPNRQQDAEPKHRDSKNFRRYREKRRAHRLLTFLESASSGTNRQSRHENPVVDQACGADVRCNQGHGPVFDDIERRSDSVSQTTA